MKIIDLIGKRFGILTVLSRAENDTQNKPMWLCQCACGNTKNIRGSDLRRGTTQACGCKVGKNTKPFGVAAFNDCYLGYKKGAAKRNLCFELSKDEFRTLTSQVCHYCGVQPAQITKGYGHGDYVYNGIDRVDNTVGYTLANSTPCCKHCNRAKRCMPRDAFLSWVRQVFHHSCSEA